jgi:hypothetical protein
VTAIVAAKLDAVTVVVEIDSVISINKRKIQTNHKGDRVDAVLPSRIARARSANCSDWIRIA